MPHICKSIGNNRKPAFSHQYNNEISGSHQTWFFNTFGSLFAHELDTDAKVKEIKVYLF